MRRLPRHRLPCTSQLRFFSISSRYYQSPSPSPPEPQQFKRPISPHESHFKLSNHPQAPLPTQGFGPWTRNLETGQRLTFLEREEEKAKEYLYSVPDPNQPLPPLLLRPPGLPDPPEKGQGHGKETRTWWQKELEIWFGRYRKPFDVQAQLARHRNLYAILLPCQVIDS